MIKVSYRKYKQYHNEKQKLIYKCKKHDFKPEYWFINSKRFAFLNLKLAYFDGAFSEDCFNHLNNLRKKIHPSAFLRRLSIILKSVIEKEQQLENVMFL